MIDGTVMPIGSCRIHDTLVRARDAHGLSVETNAQYGLIYNTKEIIQQIRHMAGELTIPRHARRFLEFSRRDWRDTGAGLTADIYMIEVSQPKIIQWKGVFLQHNSVASVLKQADAPTMWNIIWFDPWTDIEAVRRRMRAEPDYDELPSDWQDFLMTLTLTRQTPDDLTSDLALILDRLGAERVMFVSCSAGKNAKGVLDPERGRFIEQLTDATRSLGARFFNPTSMLHAFGQERAFENNGRDFGHYSPEFYELLAGYLMREHLPSLGAGARPRALGSPACPA